MDWLLAALIGGAMFWLGDVIGYASGLREGRALEAIQRRLDELT
jgi:hypothetical protein